MNQETESVGDEERTDDAAEGTFPGLFGGEVRGERMLAEGAADEVRSGVGGPGNGQGEEEEARAVRRKGVETDRIGKRKRDKENGAGAYAGGGKRFDERTASEES